MALIIERKEYVFSEELVFNHEKTGELIFSMWVNLTGKEAQLIKGMLFEPDGGVVSKEDEKTAYGILFKDRLEELHEKVGEYYTEEFACMALSAIVGKLATSRLGHMDSATSPYQKTMTRLQK